MKPSHVLVFMFLLSIVAAACGPTGGGPVTGAAPGTKVAVAGGTYTDVDAKSLKQILDHKDFMFVNVHIPYIGEIANTDAFIPYDQIENKTDQLPKDKKAMLVLYCSSGRMSTIAATKLVKLGYSNVWNLAGGMNAWSQAGYSLLKK